jgi:hypothetical protein
MQQVRFADTFWKKERLQNYADWPVAFWRELFQNSIDQGASVIRIGLTGEDNDLRISFDDNGPGMDRATLDNVYFSVGASTKDNDPTKIGGMGRARVLTCFSMKSYSIESQDYVVNGQGGTYTVSAAAEYRRGFLLTVTIDDATKDRLHRALMQFLGESYVSARVFLNDALVTTRSPHSGRHVRDLAVAGTVFARVFVNKSATNKRVIVRVNGVSMFTSETTAEAQVIVGLIPSMARQVLTANRDGLQHDYRRVLNAFLSELAVDTSSALRSRMGRHTTRLDGGGMQTIRRTVEKKMPAPVAESAVQAMAGFVRESAPLTPPPVADTFEEVSFGPSLDERVQRLFGDVYLFDETENPAMRKVMPQYRPDRWQYAENSSTGRTYLKGGNILKVLLLWKTAIDYALEVGLPVLGVDEVNRAVGFTFNDECEADHRTQDGGHVFSLRPVSKAGGLDYAISQRADRKRLMTLAKHEVAHVAVSWHSEQFSSVRERIDMMFDESECFRRMKDALAAAGF